MRRAFLLGLPAIALAAACVGVATAARGSASLPACPAHAPKFASMDVATSTFVRAGATRVRVCRYSNINWGNSQGLAQMHVVRDRATIAQLERRFNALKEPPRGIFCPRDDGSEMLVVFGHPHGSQRVTVQLSGCRFATNGQSTRATTTQLQRQLKALARPSAG